MKLNNQVIMLLSDLGNGDAEFLAYQNIALANRSTEDKNERKRDATFASKKEDLFKNKIPIPLDEGRNMFGVVDETGTLEYGQVFIQYQSLNDTDQSPYIVVTGK